MKTIAVVVAFALSAPGQQVVAQSFPNDCGADSQAVLHRLAAKGDKRAEFRLSAQLLAGQCEGKDAKEGLRLLSDSARRHYPPALQLLGLITREEGRYPEAISLFYAAARAG